MLKNTFIHIPGIGTKTERRLWSEGFISWEDYLSGQSYCKLSSLIRERIGKGLEESQEALNKADYRYFENLLPSWDMWRLYGELRGQTAFLDIETTGLYAGPNSITLIGLFDGIETKVFVLGKNLEEFNREIRKYRMIVTFNGKRFDIPFIRQVLGDLPENQAHLDLMYPLRYSGYRGGLKSIEKQMGIDRGDVLGQADGYMAVLLWREYKRGNQSALNTLVRYNLEDVVNMQYLADRVYNLKIAGLPISVNPLPEPQKYCLDDFSYDEELLEYLLREIQESRESHFNS